MAYTWPTNGETGWGTSVRANLDDVDSRVTTLEGAGAGTTASSYGYAIFDDFAGANDDAKLTAALSYAAAQTYPPSIRFGNKAYSFSTASRSFFRGMRLEGAPGYGNPEQNSGQSLPTRINLSMNGSWFLHTTTTDVFSCSFSQMAVVGSGTNATFIGQTAGATGSLYCLMIRDFSAAGLRSVIGTQSQKVLLTAAQFDGYWEINSSYAGAFHIGGSDNTFWPNGMLLDAAVAYNTAGSANGQYHLWFDYMDKSSVGPIYLTAEGPWNGIRISGPSNPATSAGTNMGGPVTFWGARIEGHGASRGCNGSLIRIEGGIANFRDCWISYGMVSPATPGHSPQDAGVIHQTAGQIYVDGCTYDHASGVAETVPWIYSAGGVARASNIWRASKGGAWSGLPRIQNAGGTVSNDSTLTLI